MVNMAEENQKEALLVDSSLEVLGNPSWKAAIVPLVSEFESEYVKHKDEATEKWLPPLLKKHMPEKTDEEIRSFTKDMVSSLTLTENKKASLKKAEANGRLRENWFASEIKQRVSMMSTHEAAAFLNELDTSIRDANDKLYNSLKTQQNVISMNPNLDGFIAEQYHVQTFNANAKAAGSRYHAEVLSPEGTTYGKNSVDIVVKDESGNVVRRYQSKYCKDVEATKAAFEHGDYRGQRKLVADDQEKFIDGASNKIEAPDGVTSNPLSKQRASDMRDQARSGNWQDLNWNEYQMGDLAVGIGKQSAVAGLQGAAVSAGMHVVSKVIQGEEIDGAEVVEAALKGGADFGIKSAAAGAIKVGVEKDIISFIPKGTPAATIANVAFVAVEDAKILVKMADGELTLREGVDALESTTVSCVAGLAAAGEGVAIGAAIGTALGPIGTAVGAAVGSTIGYIAGSTVGRAVVAGVHMVRDVAKECFSAAKECVTSAISAVGNFVCDVCGCYITTAVCEEFGKSDDCYELTTLRKFRDEWLVNQPGGKTLVELYYATAPGIVQFINELPGRSLIYRVLKSEFIDKCLSFIEQKRFEECKTCYIDMVNSMYNMKIGD